MPLPSFLTRKPKPAAAPERRADRTADDGSPAIDAARTRARRRLVGAVVLLAAGVIGFPLIFETQPRPIALDIPIQAPQRDPASSPAARRAPPPRPVISEAPSEPEPAASEAAPAAPPPTVVAEAPKPEPKAEPKSEPKAEPKPEPKAETKPAATAKADDATRAKALLDGAAASAAKAPRFIVQVGAYTDAASVKEARAKVEKLGMSSYTQVIDADGTKRTRVRVGPFPSKQEADSAGARLKGAGLPVHILSL